MRHEDIVDHARFLSTSNLQPNFLATKADRENRTTKMAVNHAEPSNEFFMGLPLAEARTIKSSKASCKLHNKAGE